MFPCTRALNSVNPDACYFSAQPQGLDEPASRFTLWARMAISSLWGEHG